MASWSGTPSVKGSSEAMRMALLTFSLIGISFTWGIEMTYCTPYLLQLGLTKSRTALVWIAGPLSGLVMQPIVGVIADRSKSKYGRRRPFMVVGALVVAFFLILLGWAKEIVSIFATETETIKTFSIALAVGSIYALDFAINAVQSCTRSLIVDTLPIPKQQLGSSWASRQVSVGHLIGYFIGTVDLLAIFGPGFGGDTQFKKLLIIAAITLLCTVATSCYAVTERVLISHGRSEEEDEKERDGGAIQVVGQIWKTLQRLPPRIQAICWAQFWAWIGWFPFLFYSTTWVGELYSRYDAPQNVMTSSDALGDIGRVGSLSLVIFSVVSSAGSFILPQFVRSPDDHGFTPRPPTSIAGVVTKLNKYKPDLLTAWICGHLFFAGSMIFAPLAASFRTATLLIVLCGPSYVLIAWAPFAFLGVEVNRLSATSVTTSPRSSTTQSRSPRSPRSPTASAASLLDKEILHVDHSPPQQSLLEKSNTHHASTGELSGIYFGILNIYTTLPQFVGTFISMVVFSIFEPGKSPELAGDASPEDQHGTDGPNAIAICLFIGALSNLGAAFATSRLRKLGGMGAGRVDVAGRK